VVVVVTATPALTGVTVTLYRSIVVPPVDVGAVMAIDAVVVAPVATVPDAAAGADGSEAAIASVTFAVPVSCAPLPNVATAVIVNCVADRTVVGVPEIVPVVVSSVSPAGSGPDTEYVVLVAPVAVIELVTGVIDVPTVPFEDAAERLTSIGVVNVVTDDVPAPVPAELVAATVTEYSVPGESPETVTDDPMAEESGDAAPIEPEETGEIVTVYDSIFAPPLNVAAPIVTFAVVAEAALALTDAGAPGTVG
jgi:hypothetical protein